MTEKKAIFINDMLKNIINVYFDTFFVFYFFQVANYEVLPLAKYYITLYLFIGIGFILIRNAIKSNIKVPYYRIGISLQAIYIAAIMLLKENIINYVYLVGFIKGMADGFYHYPKNILDTEKITNKDRQKFDGVLNIVNKIMAIVIPLLLGILLTYFSYTNLGKIFFMLFVVMFLISFWIDDDYHEKKKLELKEFFKLIKTNKNIKLALLVPFLAGFSYSSGVMSTIVTLSKIYNFKTNLNLGFVDSICSGVSLLICILFALKIKNDKFKNIITISGIIAFITLVVFAFIPSRTVLIIYLLVRFSSITFISLITGVIASNLSNHSDLKDRFKPEYFLSRDLMFTISRCTGYVVLLVVCLLFGMDYINYILILPAIAILIQTIVVSRLSSINSKELV